MYPHPVQRSLAAKDKIIVALDVPKLKDAQLLIKNLAGFVGVFKVGNQLFTAAGPDLVKEIIDSGSQVFLDLKFHDIPNTVRGGVESACRLGVKMLTVHLSGGKEMAEAAVAGRQNASTLILGVTVLTSSNDATLVETGITNQVKDQVLLLANLAKSAGITGLVASPLELAMLRKEFDDHFTTVIPGIRPAWAATGDQKRIMTPAEAVAAGADYVVIGRPITSAQNPKDAVNRIIEELNAIDS
jgi:orotidine-5'-phosphate decarboxylase